VSRRKDYLVTGLVYNGRARRRTKPWITVLRNRSLPGGQSCCQRVDGIRIRIVNRVGCWEQRIAYRRQRWRDIRQRGTRRVIYCAPGEYRWFLSVLHVIGNQQAAIVYPVFAITGYGRNQRAIFKDVRNEIRTCARWQ